MKTAIIDTLLRRNTSAGRIAGFLLSNFIGLTIVATALQFYSDSRSFTDSEESVVSSERLVVNKRVSSAVGSEPGATSFSDAEIRQIEAQPWVRRIGRFSRADFKVAASVGPLQTTMFLEAVPDAFLDRIPSGWHWREGDMEVPVIISKDYLALYNFGFASAAGMPQLSENLVSGIPLELRLGSAEGERIDMPARIAGYSRKFNTILVPESFLKAMNSRLGSTPPAPSRLVIDVSTPGDPKVGQWLEDHGLESAGDDSAAAASFLLETVVGVVSAIGGLITLLSLFILMLSISLLMEKNRSTIHRLLLMGYPTERVGRPFLSIITIASLGAALPAIGAVALIRAAYIDPLHELGAHTSGMWLSVTAIAALTLIIIVANILAVRRRVRSAWRT